MHSTTIHQHPERGAITLKALIYIAILCSCAFVGFKVVPVLYDEYLFQDTLQTTARIATVTRQNPDILRKSLMDEAEKDDIPVGPDDIHITNGSHGVTISADYMVTVDLGFYQWTLNFHPSASNNNLL